MSMLTVPGRGVVSRLGDLSVNFGVINSSLPMTDNVFGSLSL